MAVIRKCNSQKFHNHIVTKTTTKMIILMTDLGLCQEKGQMIRQYCYLIDIELNLIGGLPFFIQTFVTVFPMQAQFAPCLNE